MAERRHIELAKEPNQPSGIVILQAKRGAPAVVHEVDSESPLFGRLSVGDHVLELGGAPLWDVSRGSKQLKLWREASTLRLTVATPPALVDTSSAFLYKASKGSAAALGLALAPQKDGSVGVRSVAWGSPAAVAADLEQGGRAIEQGDAIVALGWGGTTRLVTSVKEANAFLAAAVGSVEVRVVKAGRRGGSGRSDAATELASDRASSMDAASCSSHASSMAASPPESPAKRAADAPTPIVAFYPEAAERNPVAAGAARPRRIFAS